MPRAGLARPLKGSPPIVPGATLPPPRLWNAHKRIKTGRTHLPPRFALDTIQEDDKWRTFVTPDIAEYIDKAKPSPNSYAAIIRNPHAFFSRPNNVPVEFRQQVYFPTFTVNLYRTPHLPPKYASFDVPLWFGKLDMKSYLSSVYKVKVLHIRSTVVQQKVERERGDLSRGAGSTAQGRLKRPMSKKKMTVELVEPFVWPEEIKDLSQWENENYWKMTTDQMAYQKKLQPEAILKPNEDHRKSIAKQAKELLKGTRQWKPTWMSIPVEARVLKGDEPPPRSEITQ